MESNYDISVEFGENRAFNFRTWRGQERRLLQEAQEKDKLSSNALADILVYGCMENPMYLNQDEILYVIHILRKASFGTDIIVPFECECGHEESIVIQELQNTTKQNLINVSTGDKTFVIKQPSLTLESIGDIREKNQLEQLYFEMLMHIDHFIIGETKYDAFTTKDLDAFFDTSLGISDFDSALQQFSDMRFAFDPSVEIECSACKEKTDIVIDYIDEIFN